ncbi:MAG: glycosyltransferase [Rhodospirillaceae bacterium]|nr:glycosyltransferase [Rhodospirillaceae bacterium]MBT5374475.1 glycosyltransferase [Rhodospirillaceae bacterium]MBT5659952.1 glycosyltransferase [Rhodospirillaceae bacterium]MBT5751262.1 glycosyltransferase [Rhodospirillaceae bacterium]
MTFTDNLYALLVLALAANLASAAYILLAIWRVNGFRRQRRAAGTFRPPVTILKPVCGLDVGLYENLRSFCTQDYPQYQVVFGVRDAIDPAIPVIQQLINEFPLVNISLVIDKTITGPNLKVSNLGNMYKVATHSYIAIADSDMRVDEQYVSSVIAPFEDAQVGSVTCLYSGTSTGGLPSLLASMFINEWFLPSVLVSAGLSEIRFGLGATIVVRRELLEKIGGFNKLAHFLADDHMLGKLISDHGYKIVLSDYVVENVINEKSLKTLFLHELRWARTIRTVEPLGHAFSFFMYGIPLALFGALIIYVTVDWNFFGIAIIALAIILRGWMHFTVSRKLGLMPGSRSFWLIPVRDILSFVVWGASFFSRKIDWKDMTFTVSNNGLMKATKGYEI